MGSTIDSEDNCPITLLKYYRLLQHQYRPAQCIRELGPASYVTASMEHAITVCTVMRVNVTPAGNCPSTFTVHYTAHMHMTLWYHSYAGATAIFSIVIGRFSGT